MEAPPVNKRVFWVSAAVGVSVMAFGVLGLFHDAARTNPDQWVRWFVGAALVHDFVVAPLVFAVAITTRKLLPPPLVGIVNGALITTAVLAAVTYPFLRGYGENPLNPSILPNNYAINLLWLTGLVWLVAGVTLLRRWRTRSSEPEGDLIKFSET